MDNSTTHQQQIALWPFYCLIFLFGCVFYYLAAPPLLVDPDGYWHMQAGKEILRLGHVPLYDSWSFTNEGYKWYNLAWGWDVFIAFVHDTLGLKALHVVILALYGGVLSLLCYFLTKCKKIGIAAACLTAMAVSLSMWEFFSIRPQIVTYFMVLVFYQVGATVHQRARWRGYIWLALLPPLMLAWVNLHGGFLVGFVVIAVFGFCAILERKWPLALAYLLAGVACVSVIFVNPYGSGIIEGVLRTLDSGMTQYIDEWQPFVPGKFLGITAYYVFFVLVAFLPKPQTQVISSSTSSSNPHVRSSTLRFCGRCLLELPHRLRLSIKEPASSTPLYDKLHALLWGVLAVTSIRHFPLFALLSAPFMARRLSESGYMRAFKEGYPCWVKKLLAAAVVVVPALMLTGWQASTVYKRPLDSWLPMDKDALKVAESYSGHRFLNHYGVGGWLIYESDAKLKVFLDSRAGTAYPESVMKDYITLLSSHASWHEKEMILDKYNINGVITSIYHPFARLFESMDAAPYWQVVYRGKHSVVFIKRSMFAKRIWNQESGIRNQESGIRNLESGIWNQESGIWNQESGIKNLESGTWNLESGIRNQESGIRKHG